MAADAAQPGASADFVAASCCTALCALLLSLCAFGPWDGGAGPRMLPSCAAVWCCAALLPQAARAARRVPAGGLAALPVCAAAALHDDLHGAAAWAEALAGVLSAALLWVASSLAAGGTAAARTRHAWFGAVCLGLPALEASIGLGGAPATGGAPAWLSSLADLSPVRVLFVQAGGAASAPWAALCVASAYCAVLAARGRGATAREGSA